MLLSIGMIVKNEEKYLEKCLSALKPILDKVDSELIIADTGSCDRTESIAQKYTDNVFSFEWKDDFAVARNATLEKASGEWYMFLDADEIFCSCNDVIGFFNSGEYKEYNSATYIIRSLYSSGESSDFDAPRLTKRLAETVFKGVVHERLNTFGDPIKHLSDVVEHYGYLEEENEQKFKRNSELLLKKMQLQGESDPFIFLQLYECYYLHDRSVAEQYLERGIAVSEKMLHPVLIALYCHKAHLLYFDGKYEETLDLCGRYFGMAAAVRNGRISTDGEMLAFRSSSLLALGRYSDAAESYSEYFSVFVEINNGRLHTDDANLLVYYLSSASNLSVTVYEFLKACLEIDDPFYASSVLKDLQLSDYEFPARHIEAISGCLIHLMNICRDVSAVEILFDKLAELGKQYARMNKDASDQMPDNTRASFLADVITELRRRKLYNECITEMRNMVLVCPKAARAVTLYQIAVMKEYDQTFNDNQNEMQMLSGKVKNNIRQLIVECNYDAAGKILAQYRQFVPNDPDIDMLTSCVESFG